MARSQKLGDLAAIEARREALRAELALLDEQAKVAEAAAQDAGRSVLMTALERVKIGQMDKAHARTIASAIAARGGKVIADHLGSLA